MPECLSEAEIVALASNQSLPRGRSIIDEHLASCADCRHRLAAARQARGESGRSTIIGAPAVTSPDVTSASRAPATVTISIDGYTGFERIKGGAQGVVFKALQKSTNRMVAVKVLPHEDTASERQKQRFEREVSLAASLRHPNIVTIYDSGLTSGRYFFAMEYVHGKPLDEFARTLDRPHKLALFAKVCDAVAYAHQQNIVHRDLKPGNILVDARGEPHILDFGLAKTAGSSLLGAGAAPITLTSQFMGTLAYASPEQTLGDPALVDRRSDVYALGVMLFEMLTGTFPYAIPADLLGTFEAIRNDPPSKPSDTDGGAGINRDLDTIVLRALAKEPARRYQSAEELAADVHRYLVGEAIGARRDSVVYVFGIKSRAALRRHRVLALLLVSLAAALLASNLTPWLSRLWPWPARWYEHVAAGGLIGAPAEAGTFDNVRFVAITDHTEANLAEIARLAGVQGVTADNWKSLRRLHDVLMQRLAAAGVRAVAWDMAFEGQTEFDVDFAHGVKTLHNAGAGVAVAMNNWVMSDAGTPVMSPEILRSGVLWGGGTLNVDQLSVWKMDLLVQHAGQKAMSSVALAGLAAWRHPGMQVTATLDASATRAELQYAAARALEFVPLSAVRPASADDAEFGLTADSLVGMYAVRMPPDDVLARITREYQDALTANPADLGRWCGGKLVVVGDVRPKKGDLDVVNGRTVLRPLVQAATMDSLIRNAIPARYLRPTTYFALVALAAITGALAAQGFSRGRLLRIGGCTLLFTTIIGLCVLGFKITGYLYQPMGPVLGLALAFAVWLWFDSLYSHSRTEAPGHSLSADPTSRWRNAS